MIYRKVVAASSISSNWIGTQTCWMKERTVRADKSGSSGLAQKYEAGGIANAALIFTECQQ